MEEEINRWYFKEVESTCLYLGISQHNNLQANIYKKKLELFSHPSIISLASAVIIFFCIMMIIITFDLRRLSKYIKKEDDCIYLHDLLFFCVSFYVSPYEKYIIGIGVIITLTYIFLIILPTWYYYGFVKTLLNSNENEIEKCMSSMSFLFLPNFFYRFYFSTFVSSLLALCSSILMDFAPVIMIAILLVWCYIFVSQDVLDFSPSGKKNIEMLVASVFLLLFYLSIILVMKFMDFYIREICESSQALILSSNMMICNRNYQKEKISREEYEKAVIEILKINNLL